MKVRVKLFSLYRDAVGTTEVEIDIEKCSAKDVISRLAERYPKLRELFKTMAPVIFIDGEVLTAETDKDMGICFDVAVAPPASGGSNIIRVGLFSEGSEVPLDDVVVDAVRKEVGAIAVFVGIVKGEIDGREVLELVYEAYEPYATRTLERIALEETHRYNLNSVQIFHRVGSAKPGQKTLVIAVSARGRKEAIEALSRILERVKSEVPVYKLERRVDDECWVVGDGHRYCRSTDL